MDLERKLNELLYELPQKRDEYEELHRQLEGERERGRAAAAEAADVRAQAESAATRLAWAERALRKCEEALAAAREAAARHRLGQEAADRLVDAMRRQAHALHLENTKLKKQMEESQRDIKSETFFRESCVAKQAKIESAIETLRMHRQKLEKDYKEMDRHANEAIVVGNKMKLMLNHKDETIKELREKYEELSAKTISISCEKKNLEEQMEGINVAEEGDYEKEMIKEWETSVNEMKARSESHEKELETLQKALQNAVSAQLVFQKLESVANDKIKDLESKLQEEKQRNKKTEMDRSVQTDAKTTMDIACETHVGVSHADATTQTDPTGPRPQPLQDERKITDRKDRPVEQMLVTPSSGGHAEVEAQRNASHSYSYLNIHSYSSILSDKNLVKSSSLGMLMSRFQQEREKDQNRGRELNSTQEQELCEMATQLNERVINDNRND